MLDCCETYEKTARMHRRTFLRAATVGGALSTTMFGQAVRQASFGAEIDNNVLVVLSLRGGIDGLGVVVPHGDPAYYAARPKLALPKAPLLAKDAMFGLNPQMAPLLPLWNAGMFAAVQAVGMDQPNRSHFAAMELIEDADPGSAQRVGWVNRMIGLNSGQEATEAVHINSTMTPGLLFGPEATLSTRGLSALKIAGTNTHTEARYRQLTTTWSQSPGPLGDAARSALQISRGYAETLEAPYTPANGAQYPAEYPAHDLADALCDTAHLIKTNVGTEVVSIDFGGWDMHANYGSNGEGEMHQMVGGLARSLAAFMTDLGPLKQKVTLVTISEFGRRVGENGNRGLDHGWGNMMLLMGGGVKGGQYYGNWPWLGANKLVDGDLKVTTDYRQVLGEVLTRRFNRSIAAVFPALDYTPLGVMN
jgi:uncharacterized protein (DUF1501 family)